MKWAFWLLCTAPVVPKDLARVAILTFDDQTGTKNYGYLPGSLTEAVDKSLQKKFEYVREEPAKSEAARRTYGLGKILSAEEAAAFARRNHYDIVIFGTFGLDEQKKEIVVKTFVSMGSADKFRALKERKNPADATIFSLTEKVADDIVAEMTEIAKSRSKEETPPADAGKLELIKEKITSWDAKRRLLSLEAGFTGPMDESEGLKNGFGAVLRVNQKLWQGFYFGGDLGYAFTRSSDNSPDCSGSPSTSCPSVYGKNFDALYLNAALGYALYPGNRWRIFLDLGGGPSYGSFRENSNGSKIAQSRFLVRAGFGVDFLITQAVSLGVGIRLSSFPSANESYTFAQPAVRLSYVF